MRFTGFALTSGSTNCSDRHLMSVSFSDLIFAVAYSKLVNPIVLHYDVHVSLLDPRRYALDLRRR